MSPITALGDLPLNKPLAGISTPFYVPTHGSGLGNFTTSSASFVNITDLLAHQNAVAGDFLFLLFAANVFCNNASQSFSFRAITVTGSNIIQSVTQQFTLNLETLTCLAATYTVKSGDISGGICQIQIQASVTGGATLTMNDVAPRYPGLLVANFSQ